MTTPTNQPNQTPKKQIQLGRHAPPFHVQFNCAEGRVKKFQNIHDAIIYLRMYRIVPEIVARKAMNRLVSLMRKRFRKKNLPVKKIRKQ